MMDCRTARQLLDFARPLHAELEKLELEELETHLAECPECGPLARAERQVDQHLGKAMRAVPVPAGLHDRLSVRLGKKRWGWNQKGRRTVAVLSAAAAILLVIGVGLLWSGKPIFVPVERIGDEIWGQITNPRPEVIEDAFRSKGIKTVAPADVNYDLLRYYGLANLPGTTKEVPFLFFTDGKNDAHVYILPVKVFDVAEAYANQQGMGSGWKAEIRYDPTRQYGYLIIYTGEPLKLFPKKSVGPET